MDAPPTATATPVVLTLDPADPRRRKFKQAAFFYLQMGVLYEAAIVAMAHRWRRALWDRSAPANSPF